MKKYILVFLRNGSMACGGGPLILAIIYAILYATGTVETVSAAKLVIEILTITLLAFVAGGIGVVYRIERLPLSIAIFLHGLALYIDYLVIYLINGWIATETTPLVIFTACFIGGYALIWAIIYFVTKKNAEQLNERLARLNEKEN